MLPEGCLEWVEPGLVFGPQELTEGVHMRSIDMQENNITIFAQAPVTNFHAVAAQFPNPLDQTILDHSLALHLPPPVPHSTAWSSHPCSLGVSLCGYCWSIQVFWVEGASWWPAWGDMLFCFLVFMDEDAGNEKFGHN